MTLVAAEDRPQGLVTVGEHPMEVTDGHRVLRPVVAEVAVQVAVASVPPTTRSGSETWALRMGSSLSSSGLDRTSVTSQGHWPGCKPSCTRSSSISVRLPASFPRNGER